MRIARMALTAAAFAAAIPAVGASAAFADANFSANASAAFPATPLQMLSSTQTITFTNTSPFRVVVVGAPAQMTGDSDDFFVTSNTCTGTWLNNLGDSCVVRVRFSPSLTGSRAATFALHANLVDAGMMIVGQADATAALTGEGTNAPAGPQGLAGNDGANGSDGASGAAGPQGPAGNDGATGPQGTDGRNGANGKNGKRGERGRSGATKLGSRAVCKVSGLKRGSRVACTFKQRMSKRALVTLHDRRGQIAAGSGTGSRRMTFVTARPARGKLSVWVTVGPDVVHPVERG